MKIIKKESYQGSLKPIGFIPCIFLQASREKSQQSRSMGHSAPFGSSLTIYLGHYMSVTY